eukprot:c5413_g1_i1.p1 GENE.c5413_g1_i1~~c5413_g1_i1.p1  ORF type:complete len:121 (+),score=48.79 c5413_g1_i1:445-807(+)
MINNQMITPIVEVLMKNKDFDNLVTSAILEFFDFIKKENLKVLIAHITENFENLHQITYVSTFKAIWALQQNNIERTKSEDVVSPVIVHKKSSEEDSEFSQIPTTMVGGIVPYGDDDDDE